MEYTPRGGGRLLATGEWDRNLRHIEPWIQGRRLASPGDVLQVTALVAATPATAPTIATTLGSKIGSLGPSIRGIIEATGMEIGTVTVSRVRPNASAFCLSSP